MQQRGFTSDKKGDWSNTIADYTKSLRLKLDYADNFANRGFAYDHTRDLDKAIADCSEAIRLKPDNADAYRIRKIRLVPKQANAEGVCGRFFGDE